jgi:hypothetical protein
MMHGEYDAAIPFIAVGVLESGYMPLWSLRFTEFSLFFCCMQATILASVNYTTTAPKHIDADKVDWSQ